MKNSLKILAAFSLGVLLGYSGWLPLVPDDGNPGKYALFILMFLVGISIGADHRSLLLIREQGIRLFLLPMATIAGTFAGILAIIHFVDSLGVREGLAVGAGFGYYSLSSILITQMHSEALGVIALLSNIIREIITLIMAPAMAIYFGKLAPVSAAGATSMDTSLPIITTASGKEFSVIALFHGILLTMLVPILVTLVLTLF